MYIDRTSARGPGHTRGRGRRLAVVQHAAGIGEGIAADRPHITVTARAQDLQREDATDVAEAVGVVMEPLERTVSAGTDEMIMVTMDACGMLAGVATAATGEATVDMAAIPEETAGAEARSTIGDDAEEVQAAGIDFLAAGSQAPQPSSEPLTV
jgi:hypothetical protein